MGISTEDVLNRIEINLGSLYTWREVETAAQAVNIFDNIAGINLYSIEIHLHNSAISYYFDNETRNFAHNIRLKDTFGIILTNPNYAKKFVNFALDIRSAALADEYIYLHIHNDNGNMQPLDVTSAVSDFCWQFELYDDEDPSLTLRLPVTTNDAIGDLASEYYGNNFTKALDGILNVGRRMNHRMNENPKSSVIFLPKKHAKPFIYENTDNGDGITDNALVTINIKENFPFENVNQIITERFQKSAKDIIYDLIKSGLTTFAYYLAGYRICSVEGYPEGDGPDPDQLSLKSEGVIDITNSVIPFEIRGKNGLRSIRR